MIVIVAASIAAIVLVVAWYLVNHRDSIYYDPFWRRVILVLLNFWPWATVLSLGVIGGLAGYLMHAALLNAARLHVIQKYVAGEHNEIVGHFLGLIGVIYAVVLAFVVATAWQSFEDSRHVAEREEHDVVSLFQVVSAHGNQRKALDIQTLLLGYASHLYTEWNAMENDEKLCQFKTDDGACTFIATTDDVQRIGRNLIGLKAVTYADAVVYSKTIDLFEDFTQARAQRRHYYNDRLLGSLWWSFIMGAIIVLLVSYLLVQQDPKTQRVRTIALGSIVGIMLALILIFDHPFTGYEATSYRDSQWCGAVNYFSVQLIRNPPDFKDCRRHSGS